MAITACKLTWLLAFLQELHISHPIATTLFCDNQATLHIAVNPFFHERTKHIKVDCHFVVDKIQDVTLKTFHVTSTHQLTDLFTKPPGFVPFSSLLSKVGVLNIHTLT